MRTEHARHRVAVAAVPAGPIFELAVACEVFGVDRSDLVDPWYELIVCPTEPGVTVAAGFVAAQPGTMTDLENADTVVVPGCTSVHDTPPPALLAALRAARRRGARIVALCSGTFVLAHAGLLDGHRATTHWMHAPELARRFPHVEVDAAVLYTVDDGIHTSAGTAAAIDLCLHIVRADHGAAVANEVARRMVTPPHRDGGQAQYVRRPGPARPADSLAPVLDWALEHLDQPIRVQDLALRARMSARTLIRRFGQTLGISPQQWLTQARVEQARRLLETTTLPVERVAQLSGMGSAANLRRHFTERVGVPPLAYRRTFSTASTH